MIKLRITVLGFFIFLFGQSLFAQLIAVGSPEVSNFKSLFWKKYNSGNDKSTLCNTDTLHYARYNAQNDRYISIAPSGSNPINGAGLFFHVDDTVWVSGFNFYAIAVTNATTVNCRIYYANASNMRPAGLPLATKSFLLSAGINYLPYMFQTVMFNNPVQVVTDFVITVEATNGTSIIFASNDWSTNDGLGKHYSCLRFSTGWSNNINVNEPTGTVPFDADFYMEPILSYKLTAAFVEGPYSCLGNGQPFDFENKSTHILNPQFSPEMLDTTLEDNFIWDYGDGSNTDTVIHGKHNYTTITSFLVSLEATMKNWTGSTCQDVGTELIEESDLNANFNFKANGLLVNFIDKSVDATSWQWNFGDASNGSAKQNPTHIYDKYGTYIVKLKVKDKGCESEISLVVTLKSTGIDEGSSELNIEISPNPASEVLFVKNLGNIRNLHWSIFSLQGQPVSTGQLDDEVEIDLSRLNRGVYFIKFEGADNSVQTRRFVLR